MESSKIHLVCSSGGVKSISYLGAISKFYQHKIEIASISACSMGTIIGCLIASGKPYDEIEQSIINFDFSILKTKKFLSQFHIFNKPFATHRTPDYEKIMKSLLGNDLKLSELTIPFSTLALDIRQKRFLVYSTETHPEMKVSEVLKIATAIPFMYEPYKLGKRILVDAAIATESPVWMATTQKGFYPIVVLKPAKEINSSFSNGFGGFLAQLINVSSESHDNFAASQITRSLEISINCEKMSYANFGINKDQIENLILQGEKAAEQQLKEFNYDLNQIIKLNKIPKIEELGLPNSSYEPGYSDSNNAEKLANTMFEEFKNEIFKRDQIFVSYSHLDRKWLDKLNIHLNAIERFAGIKAWSDLAIAPGKKWEDEIKRALNSTKVAIFLVTPHFLASKFIQENEMNYFLEINKKNNIPIIWIAVSASLYEITPLKTMQCVNNPNQPLDSLSESEQNIEFSKICKVILENMRTN